LKSNRAPDEDSVTAELIKSGGEVLWRKIHILMKRVGKQEE
jgi:hypothetical protein